MMQNMQRRYWNRLSDFYHRQMHISTDDFHYGPQLPGESKLRLLPFLRRGASALELGCGGGQNSVFLASRGLRCTAIDISSAQLGYGKALAGEKGVDVDFRLMPIEGFSKSIDGKFDLIHSSHAFEFIDNPRAVVAECASRLAPGGFLMVSTVHPLFNGEWVDNIDDDGNPCGKGIFLSKYFPPPDDCRYLNGKLDVISRAYPVSAWFNWFRAAGFEVTVLAEPPELDDGTMPPYTSEDWRNNDGELAAIPATVIIGGRLRNTI